MVKFNVGGIGPIKIKSGFSKLEKSAFDFYKGNELKLRNIKVNLSELNDIDEKRMKGYIILPPRQYSNLIVHRKFLENCLFFLEGASVYPGLLNMKNNDELENYIRVIKSIHLPDNTKEELIYLNVIDPQILNMIKSGKFTNVIRNASKQRLINMFTEVEKIDILDSYGLINLSNRDRESVTIFMKIFKDLN